MAPCGSLAGVVGEHDQGRIGGGGRDARGRAFHSSPTAFARDRRKDRAQHHAGREVLRVAASELDRAPLAVLADVARAIERRARRWPPTGRGVRYLPDLS